VVSGPVNIYWDGGGGIIVFEAEAVDIASRTCLNCDLYNCRIYKSNVRLAISASDLQSTEAGLSVCE